MPIGFVLGSRGSHIMTKTGEEVGDDEVSVSCSLGILSTNVCAMDVRFVHVRSKCPALVPESSQAVTGMTEYPSKVNSEAAVLRRSPIHQLPPSSCQLRYGFGIVVVV